VLEALDAALASLCQWHDIIAAIATDYAPSVTRVDGCLAAWSAQERHRSILTLNCLLKQKISSVRACDKIRSRVPQTQRTASKWGLAIGIAMAF
jgi:hypothetical protein